MNDSSQRGPSRRAVVTGASSGIGRAFAERLARDQYDLVVVARSGGRLEELAKELRERRGVEVEVEVADLTASDDLQALEARLGDRAPDLLVNNAGFGTSGHFAKLDPDGEEREIRLNVVALTRLTRAALPGMVERGSGAVINVSSLAGLAPAPFNATYGATKAFVNSLTEALYEELRGTGVCLQLLCPGFTRTEFQDRAGVDASSLPNAAWMTAEAVVEASLRDLEKGELICVPGVANQVMRRLQGVLPRSLVRRLVGATSRRWVE